MGFPFLLEKLQKAPGAFGHCQEFTFHVTGRDDDEWAFEAQRRGRTGLAKKIKVGMVAVNARKEGVIPMSGKSKGGAAKKVGKSILEKRAEKRAKNETSELHVVKQRKNHR